MKLIDYDTKELLEKEIDSLEEILPFKDKDSVSWINIYGLHHTELINKIGNIFDIHPLILEDILNTEQRPKMEDHDNYLFFSLKMFQLNKSEKNISCEQLSIIIEDNVLITFQERVGDVFEPVRNRIRKSKGRIRESGTGYLAYALLDTVIDNYLLVISSLGERIEEIENEIISHPSKGILSKMFTYKQELNYIRKSIRPTHDFILKLSKLESNLIKNDNRPFLKDLLDLTIQSSETIDIYSDMLSDQLDVYNSGVNNKLNEIMKVLTIFSVIFIPLTFITGIYGTNFEYLPELKYKYSYFILWGVMISTVIGMLSYFRRKKWL